MSFKYKILSIDGGGIRGIIPAIILAEIEKRTGKPTCQLFDLIAGTSTGGILSLALTKPHPKNRNQPNYTANDLVNLYVKNGAKIFHESIIEKNMTSDDLIRPKFQANGRDEVLEDYLENTLLQEALTNVFISSYDIQLRRPIFFINDLKQQKCGSNFRKLCHGYTMKQAAMATSAAPTYFEPYRIPKIDDFQNEANEADFYALIDGGVFANNPTSLAIMEALISSQQPGNTPIQLHEIVVVSIGTGSLIRKYSYDDAKNWGLVKWIQPFINIVLDSASESVACQLEQLLPVHQYYRFQGLLDQANDDIDDASSRNIEYIEKLAKDIIKEEKSALDELIQVLS